MKNRIDLINHKYGQLTVIEYAGRAPNRSTLWLCECACGATKILRGDHLKDGRTKSCGCLRKVTAGDNLIKKQQRITASPIFRRNISCSSNKKGKLSELLVLSRLMSEGFNIAIPFGNQKGWDILVENGTSWERWQIKTAHPRHTNRPNDLLSVSCFRRSDSSKHQKIIYEKADFDVLAAIYPVTEELWVIPISNLKHKASLSLTSPEYEQFKWASPIIFNGETPPACFSEGGLFNP